VNQRPREICLVKKTGVKKSLETVPLILHNNPIILPNALL
jgi:hypothetical protein